MAEPVVIERKQMALHLIVYASTSLIAPGFAEQEIASLVLKSQQRNARENVSGALLYSEHRRFAQALEGEEHAVGAIMESIRRDVRHTKIVMLHDGPISGKRFSDWSLAYRGYAPPDRPCDPRRCV